MTSTWSAVAGNRTPASTRNQRLTQHPLELRACPKMNSCNNIRSSRMHTHTPSNSAFVRRPTRSRCRRFGSPMRRSPQSPTPPSHPPPITSSPAWSCAESQSSQSGTTPSDTTCPSTRHPDQPPKGLTGANENRRDQWILHAYTPRSRSAALNPRTPGQSVGWPGNRPPAPTDPGVTVAGHRALVLLVKTRAPRALRSSARTLRGDLAAVPRQHSMVFVSARSRRYFVRIQRTR
jgi:hypothetical protein